MGPTPHTKSQNESFEVWEIDFSASGYCRLGNDQDDDTVWASDRFSIKLYAPTTGPKTEYLIDNGRHMGFRPELCKLHTVVDMVAIPEYEGVTTNGVVSGGF